MTIDQAIKKLLALKKRYPKLKDKDMNIVLHIDGWSKTFFVKIDRITYHGSMDGEIPCVEGTADYNKDLS